MEPVTQALLGVMGAQLKARKINLRKVSLFGALGGLAPDLDYLIRVTKDPLFTLEYHRQFTHSLFFIPLGALIVALFLKCFKVPIRKSYPFVFLGYATHGLLDAFTNYGTQLWWPFSNKREAWNCVAVVDPLLTIPLLILIIISLSRKKRLYGFLAWGYLISYLSLGFIQKSKVVTYLKKVQIINSETLDYMVKPTMANNFLWRAIIVSKDHLQFFGVRVPLIGKEKLYTGKTVKRVFEEDVKKKVGPRSIQFQDYKRFQFFSSDYLFWYGDNSVADARYSLVASDSKPIWYISFTNKIDQHVEYRVERELDQEKRNLIFKMLRGLD